MSGGYKVKLEELGKLITTLEDGAQDVREANKTLAALGQLDMLGHESLKKAAHEFEEDWRYGLDKLDEAAAEVIERLRVAKRNYQELEEANSDLFAAFDGALGGQGGATPNIPGGGATGSIRGVLGGERS